MTASMAGEREKSEELQLVHGQINRPTEKQRKKKHKSNKKTTNKQTEIQI